MGNKINAAIQVLPQSEGKHAYAIIDEAIDEIRKSGMKYMVCPFETVIEGEYDKIIALLGKIRDRCYEAGAKEILVNIKLQMRKNADVAIDEKTGKYHKGIN